jgi:fumarate reductase flavoprotein subunit
MEPGKQREDREEACGKGREESGFCRRDFLLGAAAVGVAIAGAGPAEALAGSAGQASSATTELVTPKETLTADIVVCGTGSAGMAAAVRAGELGAKVIVLEKLGESFVGGCSAFASALFAVGSSVTKRQGITTTVDDVYRKQMDYQRCASNARVLRRYLSRSGATVDWLMSQGIEFMPPKPETPNTHDYADIHGGRSLGGVRRGLQTLYAKGRGYGVKFLFETPATELVTKNGKVAGVIAAKEIGDRIAIHTPVVIIATGGYANSKELFERFTVYNFDSLETWGLGGRTGDGINMALSAGAALHLPAAVNFCGLTLRRERVSSEVNVICCRQQPLVWVNESARRFIDEGTVSDLTLSGQAISLQRKVFIIADTALFDRMKSQGVWNGVAMTDLQPGKPVPDVYEKINQKLAEANPVAFKADSIEKLASLIGLDPKALADTISTYNGYAAAGQDLDFDKPAQWLLPLKQPPFYGFSVKQAFHNTLGGLKVDELTRVLAKADGRPIPGLYACGSDAGGIWGHYYDISIAPGETQGWCSTSGLMAAEDAVQRYLRS